MKRCLVTGAGGFIGSHLVARLKAEGCWVRGVDIKYPEWAPSAANEFIPLDLRYEMSARQAFCEHIHQTGVTTITLADDWLYFDEVYALAADMGGMGFISQHHADILHNNLLININTARAAVEAHVGRYFFSSSACVYPEYRQNVTNVVPLAEKMAYPAQPQDAYGWEKLTTENLLLHYAEEKRLNVRIARFHNVFGPNGTYDGGREKAPAALCRKVALCALGKAMNWADDANGRRHPVLEIWGSGEQTRSFLYIDDCIDGILALMRSDYDKPVNIGSDVMVSVNELAQMISDIADAPVTFRYVNGPVGVRGRNSDNTLCKQVLGWEPKISLKDGLIQTYQWILEQVKHS